jgi:hypothetical protein
MTRQEHLEWAKERAFDQITKHSGFAGWVSFRHDLQKHPELKDHIAIWMGDEMLKLVGINGLQMFDMPGPMNMRKFIEGFN